MANAFLNIPVPAGNGAGAPVDTSALGYDKLFSLVGAFEATINIEISNDGVNWVQLTTLTVANDIRKPFAALFIRAVVSGYQSGAPVLSVGSADSTASNMAALPVPVVDGVGAPVDVSIFGQQKTILYAGLVASVTIEISQDGVTFSQAASFSGPVPASVNYSGAIRFMRVRVMGLVSGTGVVSVCATKDVGAAAASSILWAPGGGGDATTWAEVMGFVDAANAPITIYVNASATIPVGTYELHGSTLAADPSFSARVVTFADGAVLNNLGQLSGQLILEGTQTGGPCLTFDAAPPGTPNCLILHFTPTLRNSGMGPMIEVPAGGFFIFACLFNGTYESGPGQPLANLGAGGVFLIGAFGSSPFANDFLTGPVGSTLLYQNFGGMQSPLPTNAGFLGTTLQNILFGASCVNVAARPVNPFGALNVGTSVFDQSLGVTGQPIWWDGTQWVDATGAPA